MLSLRLEVGRSGPPNRTVLSVMGSNIFGLYRVHSKYLIYLDPIHVVKVAASTILSGLSGYALLLILEEAYKIIQLVAGATVFLLSYLLVAPLTGAFVTEDL